MKVFDCRSNVAVKTSGPNFSLVVQRVDDGTIGGVHDVVNVGHVDGREERLDLGLEYIFPGYYAQDFHARGRHVSVHAYIVLSKQNSQPPGGNRSTSFNPLPQGHGPVWIGFSHSLFQNIQSTMYQELVLERHTPRHTRCLSFGRKAEQIIFRG